MPIWNRILVALSIASISLAFSLPQAQAGDKRVVIGTRHMSHSHPHRRYAPPIVTQYPNTVIYSRQPQVIVQHRAPVVVFARPLIQQRPYNYYRQWNNGWRQRSYRQAQPGYCPPNRRSNIGHYRGNYKRRW